MITSDFKVNGQDFADWFNNFVVTNPQANQLFRSTYSKGYPPASIQKEHFADIFNRIDMFAGKDEINENEFAAYFCIMYNETGGKFLPISEIGDDAYFFEVGKGSWAWKASYNGTLGNRYAGNLLRERGVISAQSDVDAWNSTTQYPHSAPANVKEKARDCDFYKYRGRGIIQTTGRANYMTTVQPLTQENLDNLTEAQMQALFTRFDIYLGAVRLFYDHPMRRAAREAIKDGNFYSFGLVTAGYNQAYIAEFQERAKMIAEALRTNNVVNKGTQVTWHKKKSADYFYYLSLR